MNSKNSPIYSAVGSTPSW